MDGERGARRAGVAPSPSDASPASAGLDEEVTLLRSAIKGLADAGKFEEARRQIDTLCRVLRTRYLLDDRAVDSLSEALAAVLEEAGRAMGVEP
jgi:hypothetical protein